MLYAPAIALARLVRFAVRKVRPGGGSALPGLILSKIAPGLLRRVLTSFDQGLVVITGSAGKSTTTKMVVAIARAHGLKVFTNPSTANIAQGFFSSIVEKSSITGQIEADIAILEMDEGHAAEILAKTPARLVTLLNVLDDQLDRFIDPSFVTDKLAKAASAATQGVIINADDQNLLQLVAGAKSKLQEISWIGVSALVLNKAANGLGIAKTFKQPLPRPNPVVEVTQLANRDVTIKTPEGDLSFALPNRGLHFALDAAAAIETSRRLLGGGYDPILTTKVLNELPPVFARGEVVRIDGVDIEFVLVQNPTSFQLNLDNLGEVSNLMVAIGRDVHDPSWLWTVDFGQLKHVNIVTGYNAFEMALRLHHASAVIDFVTEDLAEAWQSFIALPAPISGVRTVLFSADAMRRMRRMLGLTDPEAVER